MTYIDSVNKWRKTKELITDETPVSPTNNGLACVCFQVAWSKKCKSILNEMEELMSVFPWIKFINVNADAKGMVKIYQIPGIKHDNA